MDKQAWQRLSPLLDEMLDASDLTRAQRLQALRAHDTQAADQLQELLEGLAEVDAGFLETPPPLSFEGTPGQAVGHYRLERLLGRGGMGVVWLASRADGRFQGHVAIKFVGLALMTPGGVERFAREGRLLARLSHPNIARLIDAGVDDRGQPYLVLEYVDGQPIDDYCDAHGLDIPARLALFVDVLGAIAHAHTRLILHRDIKPANIHVDRAGQVKLLDFGIAKMLGRDDPDGPDLTRSGEHAFTPSHAAPEQVLREGVSTATDVYALGVLLHGLLGGGHPTLREDADASRLEAMLAVVEQPPRRLSEAVVARAAPVARAGARRRARALRGDLDTIVSKALRKAPSERYANAAEFAADLRRHLRNEPVRARPETARYVAARFVRRHWVGVLATALVALALAVAAVSSTWMARKMARQRQRAETLVEFMLGDLRKKLAPVGRLDALDGVGAEVLSYYDTPEQAAEADAASLGRRARALHLIGEIRDKRGQLEAARTAFREAARTTGTLLAQASADPQRLFDHAQSEFWVGNIERRLGNDAEASAAFGQYLALARRLAATDPGRAEWQMEIAYASEALGVMQLQRHEPEDALRSLELARGVQQALEATQPGVRIELGRTFGWISEAWLARADIGKALQAQRDKLAVLERIAQLQGDRVAQEQRAMALSSISMLERMLGDLASARADREESLRAYQALVAIDPSNMIWLANSCTVRLGLAETLADLGAETEAGELLRQADADLQRTRVGGPGDSPRDLFISGRSLLVHDRLATPATLPAAITQTRLYLERAGRFAADGHRPDNDQVQLTLQLRERLGALLARAGRVDEARQPWSEVVREVGGDAARASLPSQVALARSLLGLGRSDDANAVARRLLDGACRLPELLALAQQLAGPPASLAPSAVRAAPSA